MKNFRRKALPAFALLAAASMSLAGVTYAWFTSNTEASVSNINVGVVDAAGGIAVSDELNGTYAATLDMSSKTFAKLTPVSTSGIPDETTNKFKFYEGKISTANSAKLSSATAVTNPTGDNVTKIYYANFDLYFENSNAVSQDVFFNYGTTTYTEIINAVFPDASGDLTKALRIGFINEGYYLNTTGSSNSLNEVEDDYIVIEPAYAKHINGSGYTTEETTTKLDYYGIKAAWTSGDKAIDQGSLAEKDTDYFTKVSSYKVEDCEGTSGLKLFTLNPGYNKISVYIWIEGQDVDCLNKVSGLSSKISLPFCTASIVSDVKIHDYPADEETESVEKADFELAVGSAEQLKAVVTGGTDAKVIWSSDNDNVTVVDGLVTVKTGATGIATITCKAANGSASDTVKVTVTDAE